jgi:hypothetical protein
MSPLSYVAVSPIDTHIVILNLNFQKRFTTSVHARLAIARQIEYAKSLATKRRTNQTLFRA